MPGRNYFVAPLNRPNAVYFSLSTMIIHLLRENYQVDPKAQSGLIQFINNSSLKFKLNIIPTIKSPAY